MSAAPTVALKGMDYYPGFCSPAEAAALREWSSRLPYQHTQYGPKTAESVKVQTRGYYQSGTAYAPNGMRLPSAPPVPEILHPVIEKAQAHTKLVFPVSQCVVMHYPAGAGIGWHVDGPRFREVLLIVSLGSAADIEFRRTGSKEIEARYHLEDGSLYAMYGEARWNYDHRVLPVDGDRYCLQFRDIDPEAGRAPSKGAA